MDTIGVVGLGAMGSRIAGRLMEAGYRVHGTNRTMSKARPLMDRGMRWEPTPAHVAGAADVVISMVSDDTALQAITTGPTGILAGLSPGKIYIDMSTVSPDASVRVAERVRRLGARMLDAPVAGSIPQAEAGALMVMVGGDAHVFRLAEPVLRRLGRVVRIGVNGQGALLKLSINISLAAQVLAFCEALLLAERGGINSRLAAEVMSAAAIGSPMLQRCVPLILDLPERAWFDVDLMHKDIRLALESSVGLETPLPSAATTEVLLAKARELGYGGRDVASLYHVLARLADGAPPPNAQPDQVRSPGGLTRNG
jgi:3-hydroxyisobutyrate dehydrogenase-like beta-hydroxyacid dehydrogenase